ncbi:hypothetical protein Ahy_B08g093255 [Arachis hypogaea]|uniref:Pentatricopeptide repeat-containing protein n=1 Tax=Arachis hypogaea TaxID=3818 RepID=A0A444Y5M9_ARAHY|nr:hypothetical protein Ahy_B08g093255 [Arachis hypogaea]
MVIERGVVPDVWSYNILIKGYCKINKVDEAKNLMKDMFRKNIVPNIVTYNSLVDGLCKAGRISSVREISYNILISGCCKNKRLDEAMNIFRGTTKYSDSSFMLSLTSLVSN